MGYQMVTPCDIKAIYTSLKSAFSGLPFRRWQYGVCLHSFSCYCLQNTRNVAKFQENLILQQFSSSRFLRSSILVSMESPW